VKAKEALAPLIFSTVLFAALFNRRSSAQPPPWSPPAPSNLPPPASGGFDFYPPGTIPTPPPGSFPIPSPLPVPTDPGWAAPPAPPAMASMLAGHRYDVVVDVRPEKGKGIIAAARAIVAAPRFADRFADASMPTFQDVERPGVGEVTRLRFSVTPLVDDAFPIDLEMPVPGAGSAWLVSITETKK